jgi:hypothetical protein
MQSSITPVWLKRILFVDAAATGSLGLSLLAAAEWLSGLFGIQAGLLQLAGAVLVPFAALLTWAALQHAPSRRLLLALIVGNALWVIDSVLLLFTPWVSPNSLGLAFVLGQAFAVAVLTGGEFVGARRAGLLTA